MPAKFKDEYQANHPIKSNKSFESEKQIVPWARMPTRMLETCSEPALQHKKRVDGPPTSLSSNYYDTTNAYFDEYSLLGQQEKFAPNVRYQPKRKSEKINSTSLTNKSSEVKELKQDNKSVMNKTEILGKPHISVVPPKTPISPPPAPRKLKNTEENLIKEGLRDKNLNGVLGKQSTTRVKDDTSPSRKMKKMIDHMETSPEKTTDKPVDFALKYKARLAPFHESKKTSEYKNQFFWKTGFPASPLLTAEQILYNNSAQILPDKVGKKLAQKSEYQTQFNGRGNSKRGLVSSNLEHGLPDNQDQKIRRSKSVDAITSTDPNPEQVTSDTSILDKSLKDHATHKPPLEYGKLKRVVSEYQANFQSPMHHSYENGIWRKAYPPHLLQKMNRKFSDKDPANADAEISDSNWFAEVLELRERANEYKRRAQGTHFSREHLVQLLAQQTGFWDIDSARSTSSLDALALEAGPVTIADLNARQKKKGAKRAENMNAYSQPADQAVQTESVISPKTYKDKHHKMNETQHKNKKMAWAETQTETKDEVISESKKANIKTKNLTLGQPVIDQSAKYGNEEMNNEETENQGRLPTPVLRHLKKQKTRHHLDLTTPCVKGILLSAPNDMQMSASTSDDGNVVISNDYSQSEKQTSMENLSTSPMFGKPTSDTHILRDEDSSTDLPMQTKYIASPPKNIFDKKKIPNKHLQIPFTIDERMGETYNKLEPDLPIAVRGDSDDDDVLSVSMRSVASSSSLASEVYQRAQKRRDEFWDKKK